MLEPEDHQDQRFGVGFIGAGPVTQAIHLPTLARLTDLFSVTHVMDADASVAGAIAYKVGAQASTSVEELLEDASVDVVAICSPNRFHAEQVIAACRAGKKAVLCEKPFATSSAEAAEVSAVCHETGVPVIVGAMHTFDPGWIAAEAMWEDLPATAHTIRSSIVLPPNARFEDFATEVISRPDFRAPDYGDPAVVAAVLEMMVLGLAIHDLPLVRRFIPAFDDLVVLHAAPVSPFGYVFILRAGGRTIELTAAANNTWQPDWAFEAIGPEAALKVQFTPSYVQAGSAIAEFQANHQRVIAGPIEFNGYEGEWRRIASILEGDSAPPAVQTLVDDLTFALTIAKGARAYLSGVAA